MLIDKHFLLMKNYNIKLQLDTLLTLYLFNNNKKIFLCLKFLQTSVTLLNYVNHLYIRGDR